MQAWAGCVACVLWHTNAAAYTIHYAALGVQHKAAAAAHATTPTTAHEASPRGQLRAGQHGQPNFGWLVNDESGRQQSRGHANRPRPAGIGMHE